MKQKLEKAFALAQVPITFNASKTLQVDKTKSCVYFHQKVIQLKTHKV